MPSVGRAGAYVKIGWVIVIKSSFEEYCSMIGFLNIEKVFMFAGGIEFAEFGI